MTIELTGAVAWMLIIYAGKLMSDKAANETTPVWRESMHIGGVLMIVGGAVGMVVETAQLVWP